MPPFIKRGTLDFIVCAKHDLKYPACGKCPACDRDEPREIFTLGEGLTFMKCPRHECTYPEGAECPKCAKEQDEAREKKPRQR